MKHKIKGKGVVMQRDTESTNCKALPKDNLRMNEGFKEKSLAETSAKSKIA